MDFVAFTFKLSFGASVLLSTYDRQFRPLVSLLVFWMVIVGTRLMEMRLRPELSCRSAVADNCSTFLPLLYTTPADDMAPVRQHAC